MDNSVSPRIEKKKSKQKIVLRKANSPEEKNRR